MAAEYFTDIEQGSDDWRRLRLGIPTASEFSSILAKGEGKTRKSYMRRLAAEIVTQEPGEAFSSPAMDRGKVMEGEARNFYTLMQDAKPQTIGFVRNFGAGCSPDALVGDDGVLEIKTQRADLLIATMEKSEFPPEHVAQCQGALWITEREWVDIICYWPKFPPFIRRAKRDVRYIAELSGEVRRFQDELASMVEWIKKL